MIGILKKSALAAIAFFGTLGMLSVGYSAIVSNHPATATAGVTQLSATEWNKMVSALQSLDNNYQEGTWTPVLGGYATQGTWTPNGASPTEGFYVKTGKKVTVWFHAYGTVSGASADYLTVNGLPFPNANTTDAESGGSISWITGLDMGASGRGWWMYPQKGGSRALVGALTQNGSATINPNGSLISIYGTITYHTP